MNLIARKLEIENCVFFNNTPFDQKNPVSFGGALYTEISELKILNTSFIINKNFVGGGIYIEQHKIHTNFVCHLSGIIAKSNSAIEDAGFMYISNGLLNFVFFMNSSYLDNNSALVRKKIEIKI